MRIYCLLHFLLLLALGVDFLATAPTLNASAAALYAGFLLSGLMSLGMLLEGREWALAIEVPRLLWLAVWPMLTTRWPGHLWFATNLREAFMAIALLSLPAVIWAWRGTATLQARMTR
jgi:hypothetical protein